MNIHKNARLTPQGRLLMVRRIEEEGWKVADAAAAAGLSVRRAFEGLRRYRAGGPITPPAAATALEGAIARRGISAPHFSMLPEWGAVRQPFR